jgi:hypothetical protein
MDEIAEFLDKTEREILILDIRVETNGSQQGLEPDEVQRIAGLIIERLNRNSNHDRILDASDVPGNTPPSITPEKMLAKHKRVFLLWCAPYDKEVFKDENLKKHLWGNCDDKATYSPKAKIVDTGAGLEEWENELGTKQASNPNWFRYGYDNYRKYGDFTNPTPPLLSHWKNHAWNIISVDMLSEDNYFELMEGVILFNSPKGRYPK